MNRLLRNRFFAATVFCFVTCLWAAPLHAQEVTRQSRAEQGPVVLTSSLDRTVARVADPIIWTLRIEAPAGSRVGWPAFPEQIDVWEVRTSQRQDDIPLPSDEGRDKRAWTQTFLIETLETGTHAVPTAEVQVEIPDPVRGTERESVTLRTEPLSVLIESSLPADADPGQFRDIKDVVDVEPPPPASTAWVNWVIGVGCVAGLAALIAAYRWFGGRNQRAAVWARRELSRLRDASVDSSAERRQRYAEVVAVIRQFLADHFHPEIASQTAEEWIAYAEANDLLDAALRSQFARMLKQRDLSRFAYAGIGAEQLDEAFRVAERIIGSATTAGLKSPSDAAVGDAVRMRSSA